MTEEPTDLDQITDHLFIPSIWPDTCGHEIDKPGWTMMCGYTEAEHEQADRST